MHRYVRHLSHYFWDYDGLLTDYLRGKSLLRLLYRVIEELLAGSSVAEAPS
jgi:hypothetical protein